MSLIDSTNLSHPTEKNIQPLSCQSKSVLVTFSVAGVAGVVIVVLGGLSTFGPIGSTGFMVSIVAGSICTIGSGGIIVWVAIANSRKKNSVTENKPTLPADEKKISKKQADPDEGFLNTDSMPKLTNDNVSVVLKKIQQTFFEKKDQSKAKNIFGQVMQSALQSEVFFPTPCNIDNPDMLQGQLDSAVFQVSQTDGVQWEIPRSSQDKDHRHVYQVASQYNAAEATYPYTPSIGDAMSDSTSDRTQGPLAQRTNPVAFELVTAFLTHLGFNMMHNVLHSTDTTYTENAPIQHGYLCPNDQTVDKLTKEMKENWSKAEYVCYTSKAAEWKGTQPVYIFLQAAPAIAYSQLNGSTDELEKYAALANYTALFNYGIALSEKEGKPVVLHATAVGGDAFGNKNANLQWGFEKAALALQDQMKTAKVTVQFESFRSPRHAITNALNIQTKARIGD